MRPTRFSPGRGSADESDRLGAEVLHLKFARVEFPRAKQIAAAAVFQSIGQRALRRTRGNRPASPPAALPCPRRARNQSLGSVCRARTQAAVTFITVASQPGTARAINSASVKLSGLRAYRSAKVQGVLDLLPKRLAFDPASPAIGNRRTPPCSPVRRPPATTHAAPSTPRAARHPQDARGSAARMICSARVQNSGLASATSDAGSAPQSAVIPSPASAQAWSVSSPRRVTTLGTITHSLAAPEPAPCPATNCRST